MLYEVSDFVQFMFFPNLVRLVKKDQGHRNERINMVQNAGENFSIKYAAQVSDTRCHSSIQTPFSLFS